MGGKRWFGIAGESPRLAVSPPTERAESAGRATESVGVDEPAGHTSVCTRRPWCVAPCYLTGSHRISSEILGKAECPAVLSRCALRGGGRGRGVQTALLCSTVKCVSVVKRGENCQPIFADTHVYKSELNQEEKKGGRDLNMTTRKKIHGNLSLPAANHHRG